MKNVILIQPTLNFKKTYSGNYYLDLQYIRFTKRNIGGYAGVGYGYYSSIGYYQKKPYFANRLINYEVGVAYKVCMAKNLYNITTLGYYQLTDNTLIYQMDSTFKKFTGVQIADILFVPINNHFYATINIGYSISKIIFNFTDINNYNKISTIKYNANKVSFQIAFAYKF
ncbi:MAG: hypothetical protein SGJ10_04330 [Bacteroidota bacterium]|nr:hypothetical protein [Bacteroidota bacterium]